MSTERSPDEVEAENYDVISSAAQEIFEGYETRMLDLSREIEAIGGQVVDEEIYADKTQRFFHPEDLTDKLSYLVPVADQTGISVQNAVKAVIQDSSLEGREKIGEQVVDSRHVDQPGETVVEYYQDEGGWTAEISYREDGEAFIPESEQVQRFVSEVQHALDETHVEPEIKNWNE